MYGWKAKASISGRSRPARAVGGAEVADEGGRRVRGPRPVRAVGPARGERAAEDPHPRARRLDRVVAAGEQVGVGAGGEVAAAAAELRLPEACSGSARCRRSRSAAAATPGRRRRRRRRSRRAPRAFAACRARPRARRRRRASSVPDRSRRRRSAARARGRPEAVARRGARWPRRRRRRSQRRARRRPAPGRSAGLPGRARRPRCRRRTSASSGRGGSAAGAGAGRACRPGRWRCSAARSARSLVSSRSSNRSTPFSSTASPGSPSGPWERLWARRSRRRHPRRTRAASRRPRRPRPPPRRPLRARPSSRGRRLPLPGHGYTRGRAAEAASGEAGRLPLPRRARPGALHRQGEVAAAARAQLLPGGAATRARRIRQPARTGRRHRGDRHRHRGRGAAPRAEPGQAPPAAVQRPPARRQVVPVHRGHGRGRLPARHVHARAAPARRRLLRPVREREEGARDARRAQPRLPVPALRGPEARPPLAGSRASTTTSSAAWRRASATSRRRSYRAIDRRRDRVPLGRDAADPARARAEDAGGGRGRALRGGRALPEPAVRDPAPRRAAGGRPALGRHRRRDRHRDRTATARRCRSSRCATASWSTATASTSRTSRGRTPRRCWRRSRSSTTAPRRASRRRSSCRRTSGDTSALEEFLSERRGSRVEVRAPERGEKRRLQELADAERAGSRSSRRPSSPSSKRLRRVEALEELREALNLESLPLRIECYDISNIQGESPVGSMVVFQDAVPKKAHYRKFGVRTLDGQDDFAAMEEVVSRRFARLQAACGGRGLRRVVRGDAEPRRDRRRQGAALRGARRRCRPTTCRASR